MIEFPVCPFCKNNETETIVVGLTGKSMGSETANAPPGIVIDEEPLNVSCWSVLGRMSELPAALFGGRAMEAAVIVRSVGENALEIRIRIWEDGSVMRSV